MPLVVEDGTNVEGANAYSTLEYFRAFAEERYGETDFNDEEALSAIVRGTIYIDVEYRFKFLGVRTYGRNQRLEWPRMDVVDQTGIKINGDSIPQELIDATCEAARRELSEPGSLFPDSSYTSMIAQETVGPISVTYANSRLSNPINSRSASRVHVPIITAILAPILTSVPDNQKFLRRV